MVDLEAVRQALEVTSADLEDPAELLAVCRRVVRLRHDLSELPSDLINPLIAIESDLDDVPDETVAKLWNREALQQAWRRRDEYLTGAGPLVAECLRGIREYLSEADLRS